MQVRVLSRLQTLTTNFIYMKKVLSIIAAMTIAVCAMAQNHHINLVDTVFVGSTNNIITHEESEPVWTLFMTDEVQAWPYFAENYYVVGVPNLPEATYEISVQLNLENWYSVENTEMQLLHPIDSDGVGFIINEHQSNEDLITTMIYRDSVESVVLRYTGEINTIRFTTSSSMLKYYSMDINRIDSHADTVTVTRIAVEGTPMEYHPNPTYDIVSFDRYMNFEVYNINGQRVDSQSGTYYDFYHTNLPSGIYFIRETGSSEGRKVTFVRQ